MLSLLATETESLAGRKMLEGRTAIVTGSTSGIGLGIAHALARAGASIMLNGFGDPAGIETLRAEMAEGNDVDVAYDSADMSKRDAVLMMVERAQARFGQVDIIVNNAGIQHVSPIGEFPPEKWDAIMAINLSAAFHLVQATFDGM
ncbi:SDR family NAD(P)-dependent oxidoreductase, partial [Rhizobium sp. 25PS6]